MKKIAGFIGMLLLGLLIVVSGLWWVLALNYTGPQNDLLRTTLIAATAIAFLTTLTGLCIRRWRWRSFGIYLIVFVMLLIWWSSVKPSNNRDWQTDVAKLAFATIENNFITVHNIRDFDYRSEFDYTPHYYDKRFDLRKLTGVDVIAVYWMGPAIAHIFLSFEFNHDDHLAISIETRKEKGEAYSTIKGFFRQYELYYVVADERDVIRLRTNYRRDPPEDVYIYRITGNIENMQRVFMEYMQQINALNTQPEFYNTLTTNCTTSIWLNTRVNADHLPLHWETFVTGYVPQFLYKRGRLKTEGLSFTDLARSAHVNTRAQAADKASDFSQRIRAEER